MVSLVVGNTIFKVAHGQRSQIGARRRWIRHPEPRSDIWSPDPTHNAQGHRVKIEVARVDGFDVGNPGPRRVGEGVLDHQEGPLVAKAVTPQLSPNNELETVDPLTE